MSFFSHKIDELPDPTGMGAENEKLRSQIRFLKKRIRQLEDLYLPCPDCRDKVKKGICLRCENQRLERELDRIKSSLKELG